LGYWVGYEILEGVETDLLGLRKSWLVPTKLGFVWKCHAIFLFLILCSVSLETVQEQKMLEHLPEDIRVGFEAAQKRAFKKRNRLRVRVGDAVFPILRLWDDGFALEAKNAPHLRGLVDIYDGARHISQCLIVASTSEDGELICDFKRATAVLDRPPLDFWNDENAPVGYLSKQ
jgi:hypothetical protein